MSANTAVITPWPGAKVPSRFRPVLSGCRIVPRCDVELRNVSRLRRGCYRHHATLPRLRSPPNSNSNGRSLADLLSADRIARGAGLYQEMCVGCHLGPGVKPSELSQGLYPQAPKLAVQTDHSAGELFWIIKHGVKLTAMPAWGKTHPDPLIWDMVAFVSKLPKMSPAEFQKTVASAPAGHDEMMEMGSDHHVGQAAGEGSQLQAPNTAAGHRDQDGSAPHGH